MNDHIIDVALKAGACKFYPKKQSSVNDSYLVGRGFLEKFFQAAYEAGASAAVKESSAEYRLGWNDGQLNEREACAQLCEWYEDFAKNDMNYHATLIRERGRSESPQPKVP